MAQKRFNMEGGFITNGDSQVEGNLSVTGSPTLIDHVTTKVYVDTAIAGVAGNQQGISGNGDLFMSGHIIPTIDSDGTTGYDLGSPAMKWRDLYLSEGSLYIDGQKVIESDAGTIVVQADPNQSLTTKVAGTGVLTLDSDTTVNMAGTLQMATGKKITDQGGNAVVFGDKVDLDNNQIINVGSPTAAGHVTTKGYVDQEISNVINGAPGALDTLNELANALGDDANFAGTITNELALKATIAYVDAQISGVNAGSTGATGATGATGPQGEVGPAGSGSTGPQGLQGIQGIQGIQGETGADSVVAGPQGPAGAQGPAGGSGSDGAAGANGVDGVAGAAGADGADGVDGADGATGATGAQGVQGTSIVGETGPEGPTGPAGPAGADGAGGSGAAPVRVNFIATAGQTTKTGLTYTVGNIDCYVNGSKMMLGTDFTATDSVSVTFASALEIDDEVQLIMGASSGGGGASSGGGGGATIVDNFDGLIALTGMTAGSQAYVTATNKLFFYTGVGWYLIATVQNDAPSAITGVEGSYSLAIDGTATTITAVSTDPEGFPLTWTYVASGLGSIATVSQADNVFTVTPSTDEVNEGSFTLTISATDGINGAVSTIPSFALLFVVPNSNYTTLLATAVSTGENNNITDASSNNHTITVAGDTYAGTFSPYRHGGYSTQFDGASDYLEIYNDSSLVLAGSPWTIECWVKPSGNYSTYRTIFAKRAGTTSYEGYLRLSTGVVSFYNGTNYESTTVLDANSWSHVAYVYDGSNINIYVNGVRVLTTAVTITEYNHPIWIGGVTSHNEWFQGNIRDFRILKGTALYTGTTLTPPTEPLTAITNTSLLICQLPYIVDVSTNAHDITVNGNVYTAPLNTYDYAAYSAGTNGGSVYFDGVGDMLSIPASNQLEPLGDDFTYEWWWYPTTFSGRQWFFHTGTDYWLGVDFTSARGLGMWASSNGTSWDLLHSDGGGNGISNTNPILKTWNHIAYTRSGNTFTLWLNGTSIVSVNGITGSIVDRSSEAKVIGSWALSSPQFPLTGYMSDFRFSSGLARYTSTFTPPTAPLSSSGSSLHIKGTDASIVDKSQVSNLKLVGNTTASTTQIKYGNSSMYFDGVGDYLTSATTSAETMELGTGDFTMECWLYPTAASGYSMIFDHGVTVSDISFGLKATTLQPYLYTSGFVINGSSNAQLNVWQHIALVRNSGTITIYLNGIGIGSTSTVYNYTAQNFMIGGAHDGLSFFKGYMQDYRITKGLARYTTNFTPPTESLKG